MNIHRFIVFLLAFAFLALAGNARGDYLGTDNLRMYPIPLDDILDGYQVGDRIQFAIEVTPVDTGSDAGHAAWSTFYVPPGAKVVGAHYITIDGSGNYIPDAAEDTDSTYNGWGVRGAVGYGAGLGEGFVNEVQQDSGIFYSTDPRTRQQFTLGTVAGTGVPVSNVYNEWDRDQTRAFGEGGALSGNKGKGNTPMLLGSPNRGVGSPVAGPDAYYTNDYNPALGGTFANQLTGIGPWRRIEAPGDKIGGSGAVTPATAQGAILNTSVPATGGFQFDPVLVSGQPATSLPLTTNAVRIVHGARRLGDIERWSIVLEITNVATFLAELDAGRVCADSIPGDTSDIAAKDNNWRYYEVSRSCADLSSEAALVKEIIDPPGASTLQNGGTLISYQFTLYNLSGVTLNNVVVTDNEIQFLDLVPEGTVGCSVTDYDGVISGGGGTVNFTGISGGNQGNWATIPSLAVGQSVTFSICGQEIGGFGDLVVNEARATWTGCAAGTSPCLTSRASIPISNLIAGTVYADVDGSGTLTNSEVGIPGVTVTLYLDDGNGVLGAGDSVYATTTTASDGSYSFAAIPAGNYIIVETNLPGYESSGDIDNTTLNCGAGNGCDTIGSGGNGVAATISVTDATFLTGRNFFDRPPLPDLRVVKTDAPDPVRRGQNLVYTLAITNSSSALANATSVVLQDVLPAGLTWISTQNSNGGGTCTVGNLAACSCSLPGNTGTVTCQMGTITPGQTKTVVVTTRVD